MTKTFITSEILSKAGIVNAVSLRVLGKPDSFSMRRTAGEAEERNRQEFFASLGFSPASAARGEQVHGESIAVVENPGNYAETDALVTEEKDLIVGVSIADCVPILLYDRAGQRVAAVHAGWRGTAKKILAKTVEHLLRTGRSDPREIFAFIGPSAGVCCYEVGEEVVGNFSKDCYVDSERFGKYKLDLKRVNSTQLTESGVPVENIEVSKACTICDENFHSHRRDGIASGRMLAVIGMKTQSSGF